MNFKISEINDSRCQSDVVCIWQEEALVKIKIGSPVNNNIKLSTYDILSDTISSYTFELMDVSPDPISTEIIKLEDYDVTLRIIKLNN